MNPARSSVLACTILVLWTVTSLTIGTAAGRGKGPGGTVTIKDDILYSTEISRSPGSPLSSAATQKQVEGKCDLGRILSEAIISRAAKRKIQVVATSTLEKAEGLVLVMEIEGVQGHLGGALTGTKTLTVRGELREGDTVIGSFVARRQKTAVTAGTCKSLANCAERIGEDIAKWLKNPVMKARLGFA